MKKYKVRLLNPVYGVPISWLDKFNPEQFEILGCSNTEFYDNSGITFYPKSYYAGYKMTTGAKGGLSTHMPILNTDKFGGTLVTRLNSINLYQMYWRLLIKHKNQNNAN